MTEGDCKPVFKLVQIENKAKSREAGRPIFEDREYVEIIIPGSKNERPVRPVREQDKERWPDEYRRFKEGQEEAQDGTPLEQWPRMTRSRVYELKAVGVFSVEDLAALTDANLSNIGPDGRELREAAQAFMQADDGEEMRQRVAQAEQAQQQLEKLVAELRADNEELRKNQKKKPGPKTQTEAA